MAEPENFAVLLADRSDAPLIRGCWQRMEKSRERLQEASAAGHAHIIFIEARSLWLSIHTMAQNFGEVFDEELCRQLQQEFENARDVVSQISADELPQGIREKSIAGLQAFADSLPKLAMRGLLEEFAETALATAPAR